MPAGKSHGLTVALVRTHSPGNLGSAARAAANFGAGLVLVDPRADRAHPDARAFASGAEALLDAAPVVGSVADLLRGHDEVVGLTSLRGRATRGLPPAMTWPLLRRVESASLVFGPERGGLTTEELRACTSRLRIAAEDALPTLNLAQAVAAALALARAATTRASPAEPRAGGPELARMSAALRDTLAAAGYPAKGQNPAVVDELRALLLRARPTPREVTLLLGALAAVRRRL